MGMRVSIEYADSNPDLVSVNHVNHGARMVKPRGAVEPAREGVGIAYGGRFAGQPDKDRFPIDRFPP